MCHLRQHSQLSNTVCNPQNKFLIKNSHKQSFAWQPYLLLPNPALHEEEDEEGHGEASRTGDMLPFPCGSATNSATKPLPSPMPHTSQAEPLPPADLLLRTEPRQQLSPKEAAGQCRWLPDKPFACGLRSFVTAEATTRPGNKLSRSAWYKTAAQATLETEVKVPSQAQPALTSAGKER